METDGYMLLTAPDTPELRELSAKWAKAVAGTDFEALEDSQDALLTAGTFFSELSELRWKRLKRKALSSGYAGGCLVSPVILMHCAGELGISFPLPWPAADCVFICLPR